MPLQSFIGQFFKSSDDYVFQISQFLQSTGQLIAVQVAPYKAQGIKIKEIPKNWQKITQESI